MPPRKELGLVPQVVELDPRAKRAKVRAKKKAEQQDVDDQSSMAEANLFEQILYQIFLGMPTKPLLRLKCLSKHWNRSISDPKFMKLRSRPMIFLSGLPFHAIDYSGAPSMIKLFTPITNPERYKDMTIVGSFNGIFLLVLKYCNPVIDHIVYDDDIILYNPFSGEFKTIPYARSFDPYSNYVYGFGYGNDLKIVRLKEDSYGNLKSCEVFSLKMWSWRRPSKLTGNYLVSNSYSGIFANGFLYWNVVRNTHFRPSLILALDVNKMKFSEMEVPDGCCFIRLGRYNGRLCMLCSQINAGGYELRVMNEHGLGNSWSTVHSFTSPYTMQISYISALGMCNILDDGKLLMLHPFNQKLVIYDMIKDSFTEVKTLTSFVHKGKLQSLDYIESSISPSDICHASI